LEFNYSLGIILGQTFDDIFSIVADTIKELMSYPKCRSVKIINNPARPGWNHREVNYIEL